MREQGKAFQRPPSLIKEGLTQPKDVLVQQQKVARAEGVGVRCTRTLSELSGDLCVRPHPGRLAWRHQRASAEADAHEGLIIQTTIFDKRAYDAGLREAMRMVIDEFTLTYPGIKNVEREYFYAVHGADDATRRGYLERAVCSGSPVLTAR